MVITIPNERLPSWNTLYAGVHHTKRTAIKNEWRLLMLKAMEDVDVEVFTVPVHIRVDAYYKGNPADPDNVCAKLVIDGLKGRVIVDDKPQYVASVTTTSTDYNANGVVITITEAR